MKFLIDPYMREQMEKIECQTCGWIGKETDLIAPWSGMAPSCPSCQGTDFLEEEDEKRTMA